MADTKEVFPFYITFPLPDEIVAGPQIVQHDYPDPFYVALDVENGFFVLEWSSVVCGQRDWVGLYRNITEPDTCFIGGRENWQKAHKGCRFVTQTPVNRGYQARYLAYDVRRKTYVSVAQSEPFLWR